MILRYEKRSGFSLIELLAVMAILVILLALITPAMSGLMKASGVANGGDQLLFMVAQARQVAVAKNRTVELRLYRYVDPMTPGEPAGGRPRAMQLFVMEPSATGAAVATPFAKKQTLPNSVHISPNTELSSIWDQLKALEVTGASLNVPVSPVDLNYTMVKVRFFPDGSTDLDPAKKAFLTIVPSTTVDTVNTPPANFATVQVQPSNGKAKLMRP